MRAISLTCPLCGHVFPVAIGEDGCAQLLRDATMERQAKKYPEHVREWFITGWHKGYHGEPKNTLKDWLFFARVRWTLLQWTAFLAGVTDGMIYSEQERTARNASL